MDLDTQVRVYNEALGVKGAKGRLRAINKAGYYEVALEVKERYYEALLPISSTVILSADAIVEDMKIDVEHF
jgi:hypothetical protein